MKFVSSAESLSRRRRFGHVVGALIAFLASDVLTSSAQTPPSFDPALSSATGSLPITVAIADVNGDGKRDVVTVNTGADTISVLLGTGSGSFGLRTDFPTGSLPHGLVIADFNGDAKLDIVVANTGADTVSVFLGNGIGSFAAKVDFATGVAPFFVAAADLNKDGKLDLVVVNVNADTVSVLLGNGNGSFGAKTDFTTGAGARSVAIGDLNGDGSKDLVVANVSASTVSVLLGTGTGSFGPKTDFTTGAGARDVALADLNGDGRLDVIVANANANSVSILLGLGDGTLGPKTDFAAGAGPRSVAIADLNQDGKLDLAVANFSANTVSVLLGTGNGSAFLPKIDFSTGAGPFSVAIGDLDGNGKPDLAVANVNANTVSILVNVTGLSPRRLSNISTRGGVLTGDSVMIGGFIIAGSAPNRVLIRSRGPSMSGAPFFVPGTLANPLLRLFSGQTVIAQNDNWQDTPSCSGFVCEGAAAITATGLDPCTANPGQVGPPPGCNLESAILITLPAGDYTGIVTGADGGTGVGIVEVFEADTSPLSELSNISTRGFVQSGANVMIGGLIIEGSAPKTVLIRARGPSMSGAPFNLTGTLANPLIQLFSGQNVIAFNDNWRDLQQEEIIATGGDPCQPNPGQAVAPPGCDLESAMVLDMPAGGYTAIVSGVGGTTGIGIVEIFEVNEVTIPNVLGNYVGSASVTLLNCQFPVNNGVSNYTSTVNINSQNGSLISGTGTFTGPDTVNLNLSGTATAGGDVMGSFQAFSSLATSANGTFFGALTGNSVTIDFSGQFTSGEACTVNGSLSGSR